MNAETNPCYLSAADVDFLRAIPEAVRQRGMYGMDHLVNVLVTALLTGGHVLLEGNPGLGKTALVRALSDSLGLGPRAVGRIQFTPDLMPADITGTLMPAPDGSGKLVFTEGPVFCNLLLADEINRATAKTQSAMLEAMAEYQVTVLGKTRALREWDVEGRIRYQTPFMVMATQNPIDQDGTYTLPEAQSDRFMFKVVMSMPDNGVIGQIVDKGLRSIGAPESAEVAVSDLGRGRAMARLFEVAEAVMSVPLLPVVRDHIVNIVQASNGNLGQLSGVGVARLKALEPLVRRITYPLGPRAGIALARAVVGWAAVALVEPDKAGHNTAAQAPRALADMVVPVLRHRFRITLDHDALATSATEAAAIDDFARELAIAAAPDSLSGNYPEDFKQAVVRARRDLRL